MQIEGKNSVLEALRVGKRFESLLIQQGSKSSGEIEQLAQKNGVKIKFVPKQKLDDITKTHKHQGVIAYIEDFAYVPLESLIKDDGFIVILDSIEDPHNLGSIIRTCECAGVDGIVIPKHRACEVNETVAKTSAGAVNYVKIARVGSLNDAIEMLKRNGYFVFATAMDGQLVKDTNLKGKIAIVIGNEGKGVHRLTRQICDGTLKIEMKGKLNSLNASVACGIIIYQALENR